MSMMPSSEPSRAEALFHASAWRGILRTSPYTISAKFAVTAFSEVRLQE
jgi:hypothetical protein